MHVELFAALRRAAISVPDLRKWAIDLKFGEFDVEDCPIREQGLLASNVAFVLAKAVKPGGAILPGDIAERLVRELDSSIWTANVLGGGFINVTPTPTFFRGFVADVARHGADFFLASSRLGRETALEPEEFPVDWRSKFLRDTRREGFVEIASRNSITRDDQIMLLALFADGEIDHERYLQAYAGRENVPWYLRRLAREPIPALGPLFSSDQLETVARWFEELPIEFPLAGVCRALRVLRYRLLDSRRCRRPELYLGSLVDLARAFYEGYNRPGGRVLVENDSAVRRLAVICRDVVVRGERLLKFPAAPILAPDSSSCD